MRRLTAKEKLQLSEELKVAKINVLIKWGYSNEEIAKILSIGVTEVNIYVKKYSMREEFE